MGTVQTAEFQHPFQGGADGWLQGRLPDRAPHGGGARPQVVIARDD